MDKNSPLPWKTSLVDSTAVMAEGEFVATTGFSPVDYEQNHERREADAALIVKAVNSHASLTEAVRVLSEALEKADTVFADPIFAADHTIDLQGRASEEEYNAAIAIREALTTAKELTK